MPIGDAVDPSRSHRIRGRRLVVATAAVLLLVVVATTVYIPVMRSRAVAFYAGDQPVTETHVDAMIQDLPFDSTSDHYQTRVELLDPSSPKAQFLIAGLQREAIQRLIIMHAQAVEAARLGVTVSTSDVDSAVQTYVKDHAEPDDTLEIQKLESPEMRSYIELRTISKAYEDSLIEHVTVSTDEVQGYFAIWGWNYKDARGMQLDFSQARERLTADALANKKFQLVIKNRDQLLRETAGDVNGDTRYKQFMRWWNTMFGIQVPDILQPLQMDMGS